jgi:hypothetical protein
MANPCRAHRVVLYRASAQSRTTWERDGRRDVTSERKMMPMLEPNPWVNQRREVAGRSRTLQEIDVFPHLTVTVIDKARTTGDSGSMNKSA